MITHDRLLEVLSYDPETGDFVWLKSFQSRLIGTRAGNVHKGTGYLRITVDGTQYLAHRLAWFFVNAAWPDDLIDHVNSDRGDNRLCNLRHATYSQNMLNSKKMVRGETYSRWKGVYPVRPGRWMARISRDGVRQYLGTFPSEREAAEEYMFAALRLHGDFARLQ